MSPPSASSTSAVVVTFDFYFYFYFFTVSIVHSFLDLVVFLADFGFLAEIIIFFFSFWVLAFVVLVGDTM